MRRFSKIQIHTEKEHNILFNKLGNDILNPNTFTLDYFLQIIKSKKSLLASTLLKQEYFAGLGNYIKNEAMYLSHINVKSKTNELSDEIITKLYKNILFVAYSTLMTLLQEQGLKIKTSNLDNLEIPYIYKVYTRTKTDDNKIVYKIKVGGRDTYCIKELC